MRSGTSWVFQAPVSPALAAKSREEQPIFRPLGREFHGIKSSFHYCSAGELNRLLIASCQNRLIVASVTHQSGMHRHCLRANWGSTRINSQKAARIVSRCQSVRDLLHSFAVMRWQRFKSSTKIPRASSAISKF